MRVALFSMLALSLSLCLLFLDKSTTVSNMRNTVVSIPDRNILDYRLPSKPEHKVVANSIHPKKINPNDLPPRIVDSVNINKFPATPIETMPSLTSTGVSEINFQSGEEQPGNSSKIGAEVPATIPPKKINKQDPVEIADIMPQYPGGIPALLDFLKKNLHTLEEITEEDEVLVKIKFVVNYNGKLESFDIIKSGGMAFDNEVLRVLKKMSLWIPGKSNGENVSVYYVVPVKFTSEF